MEYFGLGVLYLSMWWWTAGDGAVTSSSDSDPHLKGQLSKLEDIRRGRKGVYDRCSFRKAGGFAGG